MLTEGKKKKVKQFLKSLTNLLTKKDISEIKKLLKELKVMPKGKQIHSIRVSSSLGDTGVVDKDTIIAALFHDFIERGGNIDKINISQQAKDIIYLLTSADKNLGGGDNEPLNHLKHVFEHIEDEELKNRLVMIKFADRVDNLNKRGKDVKKKYVKKSVELFDLLLSNYSKGDELFNIMKRLNNRIKAKLFGKD